MFDGWKISTTVNWCDSFPGWRHSRYWYLVRGVVVSLEEQLNKILNGARASTLFDAGYDDCIKGEKNDSNDPDYNEGYSYAYEMQEKQSARTDK